MLCSPRHEADQVHECSHSKWGQADACHGELTPRVEEYQGLGFSFLLTLTEKTFLHL